MGDESDSPGRQQRFRFRDDYLRSRLRVLRLPDREGVDVAPDQQVKTVVWPRNHLG